MTIAFFDMDLTLLSLNSGKAWVRSELRGGHISLGLAMRASYILLRYELGMTGLEGALLELVATYRGAPEQELVERTRLFYERDVAGRIRPGAVQALADHRARGDRLVMLTSSSNYLGEAVGEALGLDDVLCNRIEVDDAGRFTGRPVGELCYGAGKLVYARRAAEQAGVTLADCAFYTDSNSDLPVLEAMGQPVAVNPDRALRREAARRGWPVVDWGAPGR